jgi:hypothetical protein
MQPDHGEGTEGSIRGVGCDIRAGLPGHPEAEAAASALTRELTAMGAVAEVAGKGLVAAGTATTGR